MSARILLSMLKLIGLNRCAETGGLVLFGSQAKTTGMALQPTVL